jgi:ribosomal protein S20
VDPGDHPRSRAPNVKRGEEPSQSSLLLDFAKLLVYHRSQLRTALKKVRSATGAEAAEAYADAVKLLDRAAQKSIIHKNAAARQKSRLSKLVAKGTTKA